MVLWTKGFGSGCPPPNLSYVGIYTSSSISYTSPGESVGIQEMVRPVKKFAVDYLRFTVYLILK